MKNSRRLFFRLSGRSLGGNAGIVLLCNKKMAVGRFYGHRRESGGPGVRTQGAAREQADAAERERQQMNADFYSESFTVKAYECDAEARMTPGAILRRAQQISTDQCDLLGLTNEVYARTHTAFLLAKLAVEFYAPVRAGQCVTLATRPSAPQRAVYGRYTTLCAQDGTVLSAVDSRWILVDTRTKRILRRPPEDMPMPFVQPPVCELDVSLVKGEAQPVAEETAFYTRCDQNRHMNNTYYADIVCDHVPLERIAAHAPARLAVVYHSEVPMGASFTLLRAQTGENGWYFVGREGVQKRFEGLLRRPE